MSRGMQAGWAGIAELPESLVEKILARIPYPQILKVRLLSKTWNKEFLRVATLESMTWPTFFPFLVCGRNFVGYDSVSKWWKKLGRRDDRTWSNIRHYQVAGCGVLLVSLIKQGGTLGARIINMLTCKTNIIYGVDVRKRVAGVPLQPVLNAIGADHYELIICLFSMRYNYNVQLDVNVFKSVSRTWTRRVFEFKDVFDIKDHFSVAGNMPRLGSCVYMDGILYYIPCDDGGWFPLGLHLVRFDTDSRVVTNIVVCPYCPHYTPLKTALLRCGSRIIVVVIGLKDCSLPITILQLDIESSKFVELSTVEGGEISLEIISEDYREDMLYGISFAASSNSVWISQRIRRKIHFCLSYNVDTGEWCSYPTCQDLSLIGRLVESFVVEPGLNPCVVP